MKKFIAIILSIIIIGIGILARIIYLQLPDTSNWGSYQSYSFNSNKYLVENALYSIVFESDDLFLDPKQGHYNSDGWVRIYFDSINSKEAYTIRFTNSHENWVQNENSEIFIHWMYVKNGVDYSKKDFRELNPEFKTTLLENFEEKIINRLTKKVNTSENVVFELEYFPNGKLQQIKVFRDYISDSTLISNSTLELGVIENPQIKRDEKRIGEETIIFEFENGENTKTIIE